MVAGGFFILLGMAKIKFDPLATPLRNEHYGFTFQQSRTGSIMFPAQKNDRKRYPLQWAAMQFMRKAISNWRNMDLSIQTAWETFATTYPQPTHANPDEFLTGYQLFIKRNYYQFMNEGINAEFITAPELASLPDPQFSISFTDDGMCIDVIENYIKFFGVLPQVGQFVIMKILPVAQDSGQFFAPFVATAEVTNIYIDAFTINFDFIGIIDNITFSLYLSKPVNESVQYPGTKFRYMGCFKPTKFVQLSDTPGSYVGQAGKVPAVNTGETGLEFIEAGGGGFVCDDLLGCDIFTQLQEIQQAIAQIITNQFNTSIPAINYGILYNGFFDDVLSPLSSSDIWRLPTYAEMVALQSFLGGQDFGYKLKEEGLEYWISPNLGATNEMLFNARGSGYRTSAGAFPNLGQVFYSWTGTPRDASNNYSYHLSTNTVRLQFNWFQAKKTGVSMRLCNPSTTLAEGEKGIYVGNNGLIYRTIVINAIEYIADNLAETKLRDGTSIPFISVNADWTNATTFAACYAFNNAENM